MKRLVALFVLGFIFLQSAAQAGEWYEKIKLKGDFRQRHEFIQEENKDTDRTRWRIRARLSLEGSITDDWGVHLRLATGSNDPVSTNQTLDGGFSTKGFHLDRAYFDFHPAALEGLQIIGGKMKQPFLVMEKTELIWDGDLDPEGAAFLYKGNVSDVVTAMINSAFFYIEERKTDDDTWMVGVQTAFRVKPDDNVHITLGAGYYDYQEIEEMEGIFEPDDFFGNSHGEVVTDGDTLEGYICDYNLFEAFGEFGFKMDNVSMKIYGNYVINTDADSLDSGYLFGTTLKHGKGRGHFKIAVNYRSIEDDAVLGVFADSDFRGGGTNGKGFEFGLGYGLANSVDLGVTYFLNDKGIDEEIEYERLQVDLKMKL
ncbi:MAG: putative porin [Candidatus Krumholzibacteria bacterium]|nr:putative porin [Candidatus Krumholzibacteria bacterium]